MEKTIKYPIKAVFPTRKDLEDYIRGHNAQEDETILLFGSNVDGYEARYNPEKDEILLYLKGNSEDDLVEANVRFFRYVDKLYK